MNVSAKNKHKVEWLKLSCALSCRVKTYETQRNPPTSIGSLRTKSKTYFITMLINYILYVTIMRMVEMKLFNVIQRIPTYTFVYYYYFLKLSLNDSMFCFFFLVCAPQSRFAWNAHLNERHFSNDIEAQRDCIETYTLTIISEHYYLFIAKDLLISWPMNFIFDHFYVKFAAMRITLIIS